MNFMTLFLKEEGLSFLLTAKLNQDALENVFSQIRALGGNNSHPNSVDTINRIRTLCLSKNVHAIVSDTTPIEIDADADSQFVTADLIDDIQPLSCSEACSEDETLEIDFQQNEPRNYVAGYICKKLSLEPNTEGRNDSWISVKGTMSHIYSTVLCLISYYTLFAKI